MKILYRIILFCILLTATGFSKEDIAGVISVETFDEIYVEDINDNKSATFNDINVSFSLLKTTDNLLSIENIEEHSDE